MDHKMKAVPNSEAWESLPTMRGVPGVVAHLRRTGKPMTLGPDDAEQVKAWIEQLGWDGESAPVRLTPIAGSE